MVSMWNGKSFVTDTSLYTQSGYGVTKMWGRHGNDVYLVGQHGLLAHYNGRIFRVLTSGIEYDFNDVWGCGDTALCMASNWLWENSASYIFRLVNGTAERAYVKSLPKGMRGLWLLPGMRTLTVVGRWYMEWNGAEWAARLNPPLRYFFMAIRGNSPVDYFVLDQASGIAHYNGKSWIKRVFGNEGVNLFHALTCTQD
jgi:hypothetical protein